MSTAQSAVSKGLLGRIFQPTSASSSAPAAVKLIIPLGQRWATNEFRVQESENGSRLDRLIMSKFDVPRSLLQKILRKGWVRLERPGFATEPDQLAEPHQIAKMVPGCGTKVAAGDVIRVTEVFLPEKKVLKKSLAELTASDPEAVEWLRDSVLYKDDNVLVINKPAGLAVHSGPKTGENHLEAFLEALRFEKDEAPRIVHRLDRDTSGALLLARTKQAATELSERFQRAQVDKSVEKYYWAMVKGELPVKEGRVISNIYAAGEFPNERMTSLPDRRSDILDEGKVAITRFRFKGLYIRKTGASGKRVKLSMVEVQPLTGRTHQIRVHLAEQLDLPIIGDMKYGARQTLPGPLHLHSRKLIIRDYPEPGKFISVVAPLPKHFVATMDKYPLFLRKAPKFPKRKLHNL